MSSAFGVGCFVTVVVGAVIAGITLARYVVSKFDKP